MDHKTILTNAARNIFYLCLGVVVGVTWAKSEQGETNAERLALDSQQGQVVTQRTEELKNEIDLWLQNNDPIGDDGQPTDEWLQLLKRQRTIAEQRSDQSTIVSKIPFL